MNVFNIYIYLAHISYRVITFDVNAQINEGWHVRNSNSKTDVLYVFSIFRTRNRRMKIGIFWPASEIEEHILITTFSSNIIGFEVKRENIARAYFVIRALCENGRARKRKFLLSLKPCDILSLNYR